MTTGQTINITLPYDTIIEDFLKKNYPQVAHFKIISKSLDARRAPQGRVPHYLYSIVLFHSAEEVQNFATKENFAPVATKLRPIIIGSGPAGLFCAVRLAEYGISSIILERGDPVQTRMQKIARYWRYGQMDEESNVCFGEGGAGLYSDGKLITRIKSQLIGYVMKKFVQFGAPEETAYLANPHLGSNKIRNIIGVLTHYLKSKNCELHFRAKVSSFIAHDDNKIVGVRLSDGREFFSDAIVMATGHSAQNIYEELARFNVKMKPKDFAVGVRIEHRREIIDQLQYGAFAKDPLLGAARYRLSYHDDESQRGTYSFCMCPGGYVLSSSTDSQGIVTNGMSNSSCNSPWSNAALVVSVKSEIDCDILQHGPLAGLKFIQAIERNAFEQSLEMASGKEMPAISVAEFLQDKINWQDPLPATSSPSQVFKTDLKNILPPFVVEHLRHALQKFNRFIPGFAQSGVIIAPETRTSAPVTVMRDEQTLESISHAQLYPCGEGAGFAGGITSAAVDGVKVADAIVQKIKKNIL